MNAEMVWLQLRVLFTSVVSISTGFIQLKCSNGWLQEMRENRMKTGNLFGKTGNLI